MSNLVELSMLLNIFSNFLAGKNSGTFLIEMQTSPEDANKAIASTRKLLEDIHLKGVSEQEVEIAKRTAISNYIVSLANPDELIHQILMNEVYGFIGLPQHDLEDFEKKNSRDYDKMDADVRQVLEEFYAPYNVALMNMLGWGF